MDLGLKGEVAVVTGGSEGIGAATAVRLALEGAKVAICARRREPLDKVAAAIRARSGEVFVQPADMSKPDEIERFVKAVVDRYERIDILVNNAGSSIRGPFLEVKDETWRQDLDLKVFGAIRASRLAVPHLPHAGCKRDRADPAAGRDGRTRGCQTVTSGE